MPGSRHAPTARPACDTVTAGPGHSPLARPAAKTAALRPPFLTAVRAELPAVGRPGPDGNREPARVTTTAGARDEPMFSARTSSAYRRPASEAPGQVPVGGRISMFWSPAPVGTRPGRHRQDPDPRRGLDRAPPHGTL